MKTEISRYFAISRIKSSECLRSRRAKVSKTVSFKAIRIDHRHESDGGEIIVDPEMSQLAESLSRKSSGDWQEDIRYLLASSGRLVSDSGLLPTLRDLRGNECEVQLLQRVLGVAWWYFYPDRSNIESVAKRFGHSDVSPHDLGIYRKWTRDMKRIKKWGPIAIQNAGLLSILHSR